MSSVLFTPTKHDSTPVKLPDDASPYKAITKRRSMISSTLDSLKSHFGGSERPDTELSAHIVESPLTPTSPKSLRTPQKTPKTPHKLLTTLKRPFATLRRTKSAANKQDDPAAKGRGTSSVELDRIKDAKQAKRHKSLGDLFGTLSRRRSQLLNKDAPIRSVSNDNATVAFKSDVFTSTEPEVPQSGIRDDESDLFSIREGREPLRTLPVRIIDTRGSNMSHPSTSSLGKSELLLGTFAHVEDVLYPDTSLSGQTLRKTDSGLSLREFGNEFGFVDCKGSQQEDSKSFHMCPAINFQENADLSTKTVNKPLVPILRDLSNLSPHSIHDRNQQRHSSFCGHCPATDLGENAFSFPFTCAHQNADIAIKRNEHCRWLFRQLSVEDGIWPSSDTYLQQLVKATGDESDQKEYEKYEESYFNGLPPHECLRAKQKQRADDYDLHEGLGKSTETNRFMELTSPPRFEPVISEEGSPVRMVGPGDLPKRTNDMVKKLDFNDPVFDMELYDEIFSHQEPFEGEFADGVIDVEFEQMWTKMMHNSLQSQSGSGEGSDEYDRIMEFIKAKELEIDLAEKAGGLNDEQYALPQDPCQAFVEEIQASHEDKEPVAERIEVCEKRHKPIYEDEEDARRSRAIMMADREEFIKEAEAEKVDPDWQEIMDLRRIAELTWEENLTSEKTRKLHVLGKRKRDDSIKSSAADDDTRPILAQGKGWYLFRNEAYVEHEESVGLGPIKVYFPRTSDHGCFIRSYDSRHEAILGIYATTQYDDEVYSDYCVHDTETNVIRLRLEDGTSLRDLLAESEGKGRELLWLSMKMGGGLATDEHMKVERLMEPTSSEQGSESCQESGSRGAGEATQQSHYDTFFRKAVLAARHFSPEDRESASDQRTAGNDLGSPFSAQKPTDYWGEPSGGSGAARHGSGARMNHADIVNATVARIEPLTKARGSAPTPCNRVDAEYGFPSDSLTAQEFYEYWRGLHELEAGGGDSVDVCDGDEYDGDESSGSDGGSYEAEAEVKKAVKEAEAEDETEHAEAEEDDQEEEETSTPWTRWASDPTSSVMTHRVYSADVTAVS